MDKVLFPANHDLPMLSAHLSPPLISQYIIILSVLSGSVVQ